MIGAMRTALLIALALAACARGRDGGTNKDVDASVPEPPPPDAGCGELPCQAIYVAPTGTDTAAGTRDAPLRTISAGVAAADAAHLVQSENRFDVRVERSSNDELGVLTSAFNSMLEAVQTRDQELAHHREHLEHLVEARVGEHEAALALHEPAEAALLGGRAARIHRHLLEVGAGAEDPALVGLGAGLMEDLEMRQQVIEHGFDSLVQRT